MWPFKKSIEKSGLLKGFSDYHCHILPGVDDGFQSFQASLDILKRYEDVGISTVWLTPHIMEDVPNTTDELRKRFAEFKAEYNGPIELHLGSENMIDNLFDERLEKNDLLPLGETGQYLLVETSYYNPPMGMDDVLQKIKSKGYFPVLAHPERYMYMHTEKYANLKEMGILFQLNLFSLTGQYGPQVQKKAERLYKQQMYNFVGTDLHRTEVFNAMVRRTADIRLPL